MNFMLFLTASTIKNVDKKIFLLCKKKKSNSCSMSRRRQLTIFMEYHLITERTFSSRLSFHFVHRNFVNQFLLCGTRQFRSRFLLMNIGARTQFGWKQGRKLELRVIELLALERPSRRQAATLGQHEKTVCSLSVVRINNICVHHFASKYVREQACIWYVRGPACRYIVNGRHLFLKAWNNRGTEAYILDTLILLNRLCAFTLQNWNMWPRN